MFLEISIPKQLTKFWKINVEKFTFTRTEGWKPETSLQTNLFIRHVPRILIRFLVSPNNFCNFVPSASFRYKKKAKKKLFLKCCSGHHFAIFENWTVKTEIIYKRFFMSGCKQIRINIFGKSCFYVWEEIIQNFSNLIIIRKNFFIFSWNYFFICDASIGKCRRSLHLA